MILYDPADEIMKEFKHRLASVTYGTVTYAIYSIPPKNTAYNYILMYPPEITDDSCKDNYIYECTMLFDVVTSGAVGKERGSWKAANSIVGQILDEIIRQPIETSSYKSTVDPYVDSLNNLIEDVEGGVIMRKLLRIRFNIQQIN